MAVVDCMFGGGGGEVLLEFMLTPTLEQVPKGPHDVAVGNHNRSDLVWLQEIHILDEPLHAFGGVKD